MIDQGVKLTAIIATLDRPQAAARCLDALLLGERLPAEIVIVDQSRDDATREIVAQRRAASPVSIIYLRQDRRGLSASRNAAIAAARSPILAVTDDDCVPAPGWVAAITRAFAASPDLAAVTGRVLPLGPEVPDTYVVSLRESAEAGAFHGRTIPWLVGTGGNCALKRIWLQRVGPYDERLGAGAPGKAAEDADLLYRLLRAGAHIRYDPALVVYHERQSIARRLATRASYGYGIGAFCSLRLRRWDVYAMYMLGYWLCQLGRSLARALLRRQWDQVYQRMLSVRGTFGGLLYGMRA